MSQTLNSTLQAALDTSIRHPLVRITSESFSESIPFIGNSLALSDSDTWNPDVIVHSTGRLIIMHEDNAGALNLYVSDTSREGWTKTTVCDEVNAHADTAWGPIITEMPDEKLLLTYGDQSGNDEYIYTWIIDIDGVDYETNANEVALFLNGSNLQLQSYYTIYNNDDGNYYCFYTYENTTTPTYHLAYKTSSDGETWGSENAITLTGISTSNRIENIHAYQSSNYDIIISFDYEYQTDPTSGWVTSNAFYSVTTDNCSTWSTPTQVTSYTASGQTSYHPQVVIKDSGNVYHTYSETIGVSYFDYSTPGHLSECSNYDMFPVSIHMYNGLLYMVDIYWFTGYKQPCGLYVIDPDDMSIVEQYTTSTSPGFDSFFRAGVAHCWPSRQHSAGPYMGFVTTNYTSASTSLYANRGVAAIVNYDGVTNTLTEYVFNGDNAAYGLTKNVEIPIRPTYYDSTATRETIDGMTIDAANDRLYILWTDNITFQPTIGIGYIDLTEPPDAFGQYGFTEVFYKKATDIMSQYGFTDSDDRWMFGTNTQSFNYHPNDDVFTYCGYDGVNDVGAVLVISGSGVIQGCKSWRIDTRFPKQGPKRCFVYNGILYGDFTYSTSYSQSELRGLLVWDMVTDTVRFDRPNYATQDEYSFYDMDFNDISNGYIWLGTDDGAARYDIASRNFDIFNIDTVAGYGGNTSAEANWTNDSYRIYFDSATNNVFTSAANVADWMGLRKFNLNGNYSIGKYSIGTKSGTDLNLGTINDLIIPNFETRIATAADPNNILWAFWNHYNSVTDTYDVYWGNDLGAIVVSDDLIRGTPVSVQYDVEYPTTATFTCARGHLYDPLNTLSSLNNVFQRGKKISIEFGEKISGVDYYHNQCTLVCEEIQVNYERPRHPEITVTCRDLQSLWMEHRVVLTEYYDGTTPKLVLEDLLDSWTVLESAEYDITAFHNTHTIWQQWNDLTFWEIIKSVLDHFGYVGVFDVDGVFVNRRIEFDKAADHTYTDQTQIRRLTPDTSFSNYVNQIRVIGESHDFIEVLYEAEQVATLNGTMGWWGEDETHTIYYSEDRTRTGRNPTLEVYTSLAEFEFFIIKGGGQEYISYVDPNNLYCVVTLEGPNLIGAVIALAIAAIALGRAAATCTLYCGPYIFGLSVVFNLLVYLLAAVAQWSFSVWVQPVGTMKQTIQYVVNDTPSQNVLNGQVVTEEIEDPMCYTVSQCQMVAEQELDIAKHQRNRLKFEKLSHLQDELLDKIRIVHPISNMNLDCIITSLNRTLVIGGDMIDSIEGWRTDTV